MFIVDMVSYLQRKCRFSEDIFMNEKTFHMSGAVKWYKCQIRGSGYPQKARGCLNVTVWCDGFHNAFRRYYFF